MPRKAGRKKKAVPAKKAPIARKRGVGRPPRSAQAVDPVEALREQRERLAALFEETQATHATILEGVRELAETSIEGLREIDELLHARIGQIDASLQRLRDQNKTYAREE